MTKTLIAALLAISSSFMMMFQEDDCAPAGWPLQDTNTAEITSQRGMRHDPFTGKERYHKGIDIKAHIGTPVIATMDGEVQFAGIDGAHGNSIRITCGDYTAVYAQLSEILVEEGASVERGQVIGKVGNSGRSTAPHLHYEVLLRGTDIDPEMDISAR